MPKLLKPSLKSILASSAPAGQPHISAVTPFPPAQLRPQPVRSTGTLKQRAKQLSVYLEPAVYDQLREIAYTERSKSHSLLLEGLELLFRDRGARSIKELEGKS